MSKNLFKSLTNIGLSEKAAQVYLAALDLGEATIQQLAKRSGLIRTTIYYTLNELVDFGALVETKRDKKVYYIPQNPQTILKQARGNLQKFEEALPELENRMHSAYNRPRIYFLHGPSGFKQMWEKVLNSADKKFDIITSAENLSNFVSEKYILEEIIQTKKQLDIKSRQLIVDSQSARRIIAKDFKENRVSKLLPPTYRLPSTIIICKNFVSFISPRHEDFLIIIEGESIVKTHQGLFNALWDSYK